MSICTKCQQDKVESEFYIGQKSRWCKECKSAYYQQHKDESQEVRRETSRQWYRANKELALIRSKKWVEEHPEKIRMMRQRHDKKHRQDIRDYQRKRYHEDSSFRLTRNIRSDVWNVLRGKLKSTKTFELIGCNIEFLKQYLEKQFRDGMTWENYGPVWHIDHIRPSASFDLSNPEEQKRCFHYTNLQPLLKEENLRKGAKWNDEPTPICECCRFIY